MEFSTGIPDFTIRAAMPDDCGTIFDLILGLAAYEKMTDQVTATPDILRASIFERGEAEVLIAEFMSVPVGFAVFFTNFSTFVGEACMNLEDLFVLEQYRGKGFGKALFRALAQISVARQYKRFDWVCLDWNQPSIDFYLSLGAVPLDDWTTYRLSADQIRALAES